VPAPARSDQARGLHPTQGFLSRHAPRCLLQSNIIHIHICDSYEIAPEKQGGDIPPSYLVRDGRYPIAPMKMIRMQNLPLPPVSTCPSHPTAPRPAQVQTLLNCVWDGKRTSPPCTIQEVRPPRAPPDPEWSEWSNMEWSNMVTPTGRAAGAAGSPWLTSARGGGGGADPGGGNARAEPAAARPRAVPQPDALQGRLLPY